MAHEQLKLNNQLCFPVYATSRLITRAYQPHLDAMGLTYPQYLVLLVLWEKDDMPVNDIAKRLILNTNTITPLLKRMEEMKLIERRRSMVDERKVIVHLTPKAQDLEAEAAKVPQALVEQISGEDLTMDDLVQMRDTLNALIESLSK